MSRSQPFTEHRPTLPESRPEAQPTVPRSPAPAGETAGEGGERKKPDPTRYGDWEINGRCIDF